MGSHIRNVSGLRAGDVEVFVCPFFLNYIGTELHALLEMLPVALNVVFFESVRFKALLQRA